MNRYCLQPTDWPGRPCGLLGGHPGGHLPQDKPLLGRDVPIVPEPLPIRSPGTEMPAPEFGFCGQCREHYMPGAEIVLAAVTEDRDAWCHFDCTRMAGTGKC